GEGEKVILGCLAQDFFPRSVSFQWTSDSNTEVDSDNFIFSQHNSNNRFTGVSVISVPRSKVLSYKCSLNHTEGNKNVEVGYAISSPDVTLVSVPNGEKQVLVCSIENMATKKASFTWEKNNNIVISTAIKSSAPLKSGPLYSDVSILKVNQTDWNNKDVYTCEVMHQGQTYIQKASKGRPTISPITVTLDPPTPKEMFTNKQVKLKCTVRGQDNS
uniref:Ig-like domain-containing protein n=1 Tax=Cyprinodon variegatus TaxID=28743 RepID=A0A3Q2CPL5_CYPVA